MIRKAPFTAQSRGRKQMMTMSKEIVIRDAVLYFVRNNSPRSRDGLKDLVQYFLLRLPVSRPQNIVFNNGIPGNVFIQNFLSRRSDLAFKFRSKFDRSRELAISQGKQFPSSCSLHQEYQKNNIKSGEQVFNIDESGFSASSADRSKAKALFNGNTRSYSVALEYSSNSNHVTIMPVLLVCGRSWNHLIVLQGKCTNYRVMEDVSTVTTASYLPL